MRSTSSDAWPSAKDLNFCNNWLRFISPSCTSEKALCNCLSADSKNRLMIYVLSCTYFPFSGGLRSICSTSTMVSVSRALTVWWYLLKSMVMRLQRNIDSILMNHSATFFFGKKIRYYALKLVMDSTGVNAAWISSNCEVNWSCEEVIVISILFVIADDDVGKCVVFADE